MLRPTRQLSLFVSICLLTVASSSFGDAPAFLIRVPVPITGTVDTRVIRGIERIQSEAARRGDGLARPTLVLEFWPQEGSETADASSFERCLALARYLAGSSLDGFRTVAYLPRTITGHSVLPVIACEQIVMHPEARLGNANADQVPITATTRSAYSEIANRRQTVPVPVALGMLDPQLTVYKITTDAGVRFELEESLAEARQSDNVLAVDTLKPAGQIGLFSADELRVDLGLVSHLASDRRELAAALDVQASLLEPDPSLGAAWQPILVELEGIVTDKKVDSLIRVMEEHLRLGSANFICLRMNSPGGSPAASLRLAGWLADLDSSQVRTVGFVSRQALADASLIAAACDHIVLQHNAVIGGPGEHEFAPDELAAVRLAVQDILARKGRYWSLPMAMIDPELEVYRYTLQDSDIQEYWTAEESASIPQSDRWRQGESITQPGQFLAITADNAEQFHVANFLVDSLEELRMAYQVDSDLTLVRPGWADEFIEFLASPHVAIVLLFFAGFALMAELSTPGIGVGGFISAVCFVLFFWSQFLHGTATILEVLLFLTGIMFIAAEIFLIPGVGIFGFGGGLLVIASLVLASQTFVVPRNDYQLQQLPRSLLTVVAATGGVITGVVLLRRYLEKAPFLRHVMLTPPADDELDTLRKRELITDLSWAQGQTGVATTPLMPSGKARIGDRLVDVVTVGEPIDRGTQVEVVEVQAYRVVVRAVPSNRPE